MKIQSYEGKDFGLFSSQTKQARFRRLRCLGWSARRVFVLFFFPPNISFILLWESGFLYQHRHPENAGEHKNINTPSTWDSDKKYKHEHLPPPGAEALPDAGSSLVTGGMNTSRSEKEEKKKTSQNSC